MKKITKEEKELDKSLLAIKRKFEAMFLRDLKRKLKEGITYDKKTESVIFEIAFKSSIMVLPEDAKILDKGIEQYTKYYL